MNYKSILKKEKHWIITNILFLSSIVTISFRSLCSEPSTKCSTLLMERYMIILWAAIESISLLSVHFYRTLFPLYNLLDTHLQKSKNIIFCHKGKNNHCVCLSILFQYMIENEKLMVECHEPFKLSNCCHMRTRLPFIFQPTSCHRKTNHHM